MVRQEVVEKKVDVTCDRCAGKTSEGGWIQLTRAEDIGFRLFELQKKLNHLEGRHITRRNDLDFCSRACCIAYLTEDIQLFVAELTAPRNINQSVQLL